MANKPIDQLIAANAVQPNDLFPFHQNGAAKKLKAGTLELWLLQLADGHGGIHAIEKVKSSGLTDTYRITLADTTTYDFTVTNGRSINSIAKTKTSGLTDTYTITYNNETTSTFTVKNGRSVSSIVKTGSTGLADTYTITYNDNTTSTFTVYNGRGIKKFEQAKSDGLVDTYTFTYDDGTTNSFSVKNGRSVDSIGKTGSNGLVDTYTVAYNDRTSSTFHVSNGRGISKFEVVKTDGLAVTYRMTFNDGTFFDMTVTNGAKGDKGDNTYTHIKFASQEPTEESHSFGDAPDAWVGWYWGPLAEAPTDWAAYKWYRQRGDKGDPGVPAKLIEQSIAYQVGTSATIPPSGTWMPGVPTVPQGNYLWTRTTIQFNTGDAITWYTKSREGKDGTGSVVSVNGSAPDADGNVTIETDITETEYETLIGMLSGGGA